MVNEFSSTYANQQIFDVHYIYIPNHCCGLIIGKKGQTIKRLEAISGAKLTFKSKEANFTHTPLKIFGSMAAIHNAREYINEILLANNERYSLPQQLLNVNSSFLYGYSLNYDNVLNNSDAFTFSDVNLKNISHKHLFRDDLSYLQYKNSNINHLERLFGRYTCIGETDGINEIFNNLPNEIWCKIFSNITYNKNNSIELLRLRLVSKRWNNIIDNLCIRGQYKVVKKLIKIQFLCYYGDSAEDWIVNLSKSERDSGINCKIKDLQKYIRFLNFEGKLLFCESGSMNEYIFDCLLQYRKFIKPRTVTFTGGLLNINKKGMLAFLGMMPSIEKLHFQWCEPQNNFFDDSFLIVCPNVKGFLIQQTTRSLRNQPRINFTMGGLTQAISLKTDYIFIPFVRNFRQETVQRMMEKYFRLCDGNRQKYMAMISVGHIKRPQINAALDNLGWITREDNSTLAYQIPRPNLIKKDLPLFFHSVDCTGTLIITTYNNGDKFGRYGAPILHFNNRTEFTVNEKSMIWNVHNDL
ncbi:F-box domain and K Homology domain and K Homology domain, type 1-containing protein [Strongyloides ratti]|uniref:F-box domain and K Homology domain and K Homology domain, type 1-containing protein n=1 Tax=Strongyloides ratti TaxID=34506 RepID=A0A090KYM2_STRRB|nr:F-box domain and K Homology domain and K Homology domain, type 1-containing protein [Strongyloides ratti]CEF60982.1 F-box domain and K Homology domain and K Homology domain, type 1-containing protein [Strongyloides ratti]